MVREVSANAGSETRACHELNKPKQGYHQWDFANSEILLMRLRLNACAVGFGDPLIAGGNGGD